MGLVRLVFLKIKRIKKLFWQGSVRKENEVGGSETGDIAECLFLNFQKFVYSESIITTDINFNKAFRES